MKPFSFPVWVLVNQRNRAKEGFPYYFMTRGGAQTPLPETLPVFTTEALAKQICSGEPFREMEVDLDGFYEILTEQKEIENVLLDMGTPNATNYRVETLLARIKTDS